MIDTSKYKYENKETRIVPQRSYATSCEKAFDFAGEQGRNYPRLERLCADFGMRVLHVPALTGGHSYITDQTDTIGYSLVVDCGAKVQQLTPAFADRLQLETFVTDNMVDILHHYFCTETIPS